MRAVLHGEEIIYEGKPIQEQSAAVKSLIDSFNAKEQIKKRCVQEIHSTAIERCTQASDIANVRSHAQSGVHSALEDLDAEATSHQADQYELDPGPAAFALAQSRLTFWLGGAGFRLGGGLGVLQDHDQRRRLFLTWAWGGTR